MRRAIVTRVTPQEMERCPWTAPLPAKRERRAPLWAQVMLGLLAIVAVEVALAEVWVHSITGGW
ncbi:MAG: hypothetical protein KGL39_44920 [Patescibacteria group bacterium]|nr:hypothetical protein [Patescibacteria group bacterium]